MTLKILFSLKNTSKHTKKLSSKYLIPIFTFNQISPEPFYELICFIPFLVNLLKANNAY